MKKENFKNLLTDLYKIYNPANIQHIDNLVEKYNRLEFDALQNIFIKYNVKSNKHYDKNIGTDEFILNLIKEYNSGLRGLNVLFLDKKNENITEQEIETIIDVPKIEIQTPIIENEKLDNNLNKKEDSFKKHLEDIYEDFENKIVSLNKSNDNATIRIFSVHSNTELNLPNKKIISQLGQGARLIIKDENNKTIAMEIIDVIYDGISNLDGSPLIEVFLDIR